MMKKCKRCGKEFKVGARGDNKVFCSVECRGKYWLEHNRERIKLVCECCGKTFGRPRRTNIKGKKIRYCSRNCANKSTRSSLIKQKTKKHKYISIWKPEHPNNVDGRMKEHILVMEKKIGRYIKKGEIVHHINYLEDDDREENLFLCNTYKEHDKIHRESRYLIKEFIREKGLSEELTEYMIKNCSDLKIDNIKEENHGK